MSNYDRLTAAEIKIIAYRLLGDPNRALSTRKEWRYGHKGSLAVDLVKNSYYDHEAGAGGGVLDLVVRERGGSHQDARAWLCDEGLVNDNCSQASRISPTPADRRDEALAIWEASRPALYTPAAEYLVYRGITIEPPVCIRYHERLHALVAMVQKQDGTFSGIQRVYLKTDARGTWKRDRRSLGTVKGGAIRLTPTANTLQLCESLEDGLALLQMTGRPTWAVPGAGFMPSFEPPSGVGELILAPDHDRAGLESIKKAAAKRNHGCVYRELLPPHGMDWCDVLVDFDERAAILEFGGEEVRDAAERRAWMEVFSDDG